MTDFTASNGTAIEVNSLDPDRLVIHPSRVAATLMIHPPEVAALREFFRAEEDERLGRWRFPGMPWLVVYHWGQPVPAGVVVFDEGSGTLSRVLHRDADPENQSPDYLAARAYFDAHPEPKPWWDAQHDEVWELTTPATGERPYQVVRTEEAGFRFFLISDHEGFRPGLFPDEVQITDGRRIWPADD